MESGTGTRGESRTLQFSSSSVSRNQFDMSVSKVSENESISVGMGESTVTATLLLPVRPSLLSAVIVMV